MKQTEDIVFDLLQTCLLNLAGGSGHLVAYHLNRETFVISSVVEIHDLTQYTFEVEGVRESEFSVEPLADVALVPDSRSIPGTESLKGSITLQADNTLAYDEEGQALLSPWKTQLLPTGEKFKHEDEGMQESSNSETLSAAEIDFLLQKPE